MQFSATRLRTHNRRHRRGQGLVEFALVLPVILLLTMIALDFGRIYLGYINLQNLTRIAANIAANNSEAWADNDTEVLTRYQNQIALDASATNCELLGGTAPAPTFTDVNGDGITNGVGDYATVALTCSFGVITPFVSNIVGGSVDVSASTVFPVSTGMTGTAAGGGCFLEPNAAINVSPSNAGVTPFEVTFTDASGGCPASMFLWDFGDGTAVSNLQDPPPHTFTTVQTYTVSLTTTNAYGSTTATEEISVTDVVVEPQLCIVPAFAANEVQLSAAQGLWSAAGFTTTVSPTNGNFKIKSQTLTGLSEVPCDSSITVGSN
jgi:PKD repeat protein